ncbi:thiamine pyrophosphate-dependent enzyme [Palleronia caenipelagi]|uniref:Thiamine pyrophosphate-binding protein n=1 Tax=Palleronia caenipelagi TaxID=2489174 RepID=A0A547PL56_9RHOB|nr:thiamine pyrophosphate-dependent enzyme [Palleronia caenipelagi]TRD14872.1 thiamine pyrophosphate-binding protein [Palleronia caenipelagi]
MSMTNFQACGVIHQFRGDALITNTMSAMFAISAVSPSPLNLASVPLMGGASGLGLGLAIAQPNRQVMVLDGDSSLLMELGTLAQIGDVAPANFIHFVFNNSLQFSGVANLDRPGRNLDFCAVALGAGYASAQKIETPEALAAAMPELLEQNGPHMVELIIRAPEKFTHETPQPEIPELQFTRMGAESAAMMDALGTTR